MTGSGAVRDDELIANDRETSIRVIPQSVREGLAGVRVLGEEHADDCPVLAVLRNRLIRQEDVDGRVVLSRRRGWRLLIVVDIADVDRERLGEVHLRARHPNRNGMGLD